MTKKKTATPSGEKNYLRSVPKELWDDILRKGIYKLYPGKQIVIAGFIVKNETKQLIKIVSGEAVPVNCTVDKL